MRRRLAIGFLVVVVGLAVGSVGMAYAVVDGEPDVEVDASCYPGLPSPRLALQSIQQGDSVTSYWMAVTNWSAFPEELFGTAPELPPCGSNPNASRTWLEIYDRGGSRIYGYCAFTSASDMGSFALNVREGDTPPSSVYITLVDRECGAVYTSNRIPIVPIDATIDIKPGSDPNSINCGNEDGVITVAILTTEEYDATIVDHTTVTFEGAGEIHRDVAGSPIRHEEDVDDDGDMDLVFHFRLGDTDLDCESTAGTLSGETFAGLDIEGTDEVRMVSTVCRPSLRLPKEGAVLDNGRTDGQDDIVWDFAWSECRGAEAYNLYVIGPPPNVVYPLIDVYLPLSLSYHHACTSAYIADMNRLGWTWKVRAMVDGQWGEWSKVRTFDVEPVNTDPAQ
jgi:hypothetical protein